MKSLCEAALHNIEAGTPLVLVTMMDQSGSVPRTAGARMLVRPDGGIWGTVGGGRYEAEAITLAKRLLRHKAPATGQDVSGGRPGAVLEYSLKGVTDMDMICGGALSLLLEVIPADGRSKELFSSAHAAEKEQSPFIFISRFTRDEHAPAVPEESAEAAPGEVGIEAGSACAAMVERFVYLPEKDVAFPAGGNIPPSILSDARALNSPIPRHGVSDMREYLLELFDRPYRIIIFGGGHVSLELSKLAIGVDFPVVVLDDRAEFANAGRFPGARVLVPPSLTEEDSAACLSSMNAGPRDGIVIVTRGHAHDRDVLAAALNTEAGYIGMIGSKVKREAVYKSLLQRGYRQEQLDAVYSPIGLAIGADTPQEIAVSIAAELIQWRKKARDAESGKLKSPELCKSMGCAKQ